MARKQSRATSSAKAARRKARKRKGIRSFHLRPISCKRTKFNRSSTENQVCTKTLSRKHIRFVVEFFPVVFRF